MKKKNPQKIRGVNNLSSVAELGFELKSHFT